MAVSKPTASDSERAEIERQAELVAAARVALEFERKRTTFLQWLPLLFAIIGWVWGASKISNTAQNAMSAALEVKMSVEKLNATVTGLATQVGILDERTKRD